MIRFKGMPTESVRMLQQGGVDVQGQVAEHAISDGEGNPCRHCLQMIEKKAPFLIVAWRPFAGINPYTETGPIFLHSTACKAFDSDSDALPQVLEGSPDFIMRGYDVNERIVYGTGGVVLREHIVQQAIALFANEQVCFVHVRSSSNNCWQARIDSGVAMPTTRLIN
ncbi:MAG: DUF1203 domain-containing protein [Granulosicoccus sp.]